MSCGMGSIVPDEGRAVRDEGNGMLDEWRAALREVGAGAGGSDWGSKSEGGARRRVSRALYSTRVNACHSMVQAARC
jgi:hypothetical protein